MPYLRLEGAKQNDPHSDDGKEAMRKGMQGLETVLQHHPENWSARWMLGKAQQAQNKHEEAYQSFRAAHKNVLSNRDVLRELSLECLHTKRFSEAVHYCHVAMEFDPDDSTLLPNMAVAKLFSGNVEDAERWAKKAIAKIPDDVPARAVMQLVNEIRAGKRNIPTDFNKLCKGEE